MNVQQTCLHPFAALILYLRIPMRLQTRHLKVYCLIKETLCDVCRQCMETKKIMTRQPAVLHALLEHLTEALIVYVIHQIDSGAQVKPPVHSRENDISCDIDGSIF